MHLKSYRKKYKRIIKNKIDKCSKQLYDFVGYEKSYDIIHNISEAIYLTLALSDVK